MEHDGANMSASHRSLTMIAAAALRKGYPHLARVACTEELKQQPDSHEARRLLSIVNDRERLFQASSPLLAYRANINSQNGEDGILAEILMRLNIGTGWFCEFGAWDGIHLSNRFALACQGWRGVYIEGDEAKYQDLLQTCAKFPPDALYPISAFVHESEEGRTLDALLSTTPIPAEFEVLSIDIDSSDYHIWKSLLSYRPKIVIVEVNSTIPTPVVAIHGEGVSGSSFQAMANLAREKGYTPVCHTGNLIAVRDDLVEPLGLPDSVLQNPAGLFDPKWVSARIDQLFD